MANPSATHRSTDLISISFLMEPLAQELGISWIVGCGTPMVLQAQVLKAVSCCTIWQSIINKSDLHDLHLHTSFTAQVVMNKLVCEAEDVIHPNSGLHTSHGSQLCWTDLSSTTVASVTDIIQKHQPLTWQYVTTICGRPPRKRNGVTALWKYRPVTGVSY